jgi:hypothetical protein
MDVQHFEGRLSVKNLQMQMDHLVQMKDPQMQMG